MKTAAFDYTDMAAVDSSFIDSVYYNEKSQELAVFLLNGSTHFYGPVPYRIFNDMVHGGSAGYVYNRDVRDKLTNLGGGAVQNVKFVKIQEGVYKTFRVTGVSVETADYSAYSAAEAAKMFVEDFDDVTVTEVTEVD
jgi:hypothetical protein